MLVTGSFVKTSSTSIRGIHVAREIALVDGHPSTRTTHMMIETRPVGRAELTIVEFPVDLDDPDATPPSISRGRRPAARCSVRLLGSTLENLIRQGGPMKCGLID